MRVHEAEALNSRDKHVTCVNTPIDCPDRKEKDGRKIKKKKKKERGDNRSRRRQKGQNKRAEGRRTEQ